MPQCWGRGGKLKFDMKLSAFVARALRAFIELGLVNRDDPLTKLVAERLINLARQEQRNPHQLCDAVLSSLK